MIPRSAITLLLAGLVVAGCGTTQGTAQTAPAPAAPPPNAADVRFMSTMIGHHAQAIDMARLAPTHGASPTIQTLAARVINAQQDEIALMQQWLRDHGQPVPEAVAATKHVMDGVEHEMLMPGMLTAAQMKELDAARGEDFDRLFLRLMIQHHQGAVTMVNELITSYGAAQDNTVFKIASDINVDQTTEIARMQRMLFDLIMGKTDQ
jgi:uncharacterized protein (DUF305 family)